MKSMRVRIGIAAILCAAVIAALLIAVPPTTVSAAPKVVGEAHQVHQAPSQSTGCTWTVQRNERLYQIAARFGTTTAYLATLNNLFNPNYIYTGQVLHVPCVPQPHPKPNPGICDYYTVQRGDWLKTIAARFGVPWQLLAQVNGLSNANYIYAGQKLAIPCANPPVCPGCWPCQGCPPPVVPTPPPPVCSGCWPCQGCPPPPPVYPTPTPVPPVCPGCWPCQGCPPVIGASVTINDNGYNPSVVTVKQGQWVEWRNAGQHQHTVTQGLCPNGHCTPTPGGFNSGPLHPNGMYAFQFNQLGTFAYFDGATGIAGTVAVVPH